MKFQETHFEEYIASVKKLNLHPNCKSYYSHFPSKIQQMKNVIFFGPSGVGKYSQMLFSIKKYSPTELKYEKKINILYDKEQYCFKISDIHYEVDLSLLGCNSKLLWHEIYQQIIESISSKPNKTGILVCKHFHSINNELLENFYSHMQDNSALPVKIIFILITEQIGFIPDTILNCCEIIPIPRPSKKKYLQLIEAKPSLPIKTNTINTINTTNTINTIQIENIKCFKSNIDVLNRNYKILCDKIIHNIVNIDTLQYLKFRDIIYDLFIYNLDIYQSIGYILTSLIQSNHISPDKMSKVWIQTYTFFKYYNNNYRPICHLEKYLFYLATVSHYT